jgi:putative phosphoesterase
MEIGIIADTHGFLDDNVFRVFDDCDEIWHAGDFGTIEVLEKLREFKPLKAVYGNIDDPKIRASTVLDERFACENVRVWMTHIAGHPGRYTSRVRKLLTIEPPDVLICGHSHIVSVENDRKYRLKYLNPGAAGHEGHHLVRTLLKATFAAGRMFNLRLIELGPRGRAQLSSNGEG